MNPLVEFDPNLPITEKLGDIERLLADHAVVIVAGETGSGKSTQLPKLCLKAGFAERGLIGHTQPRRLAARNIAARVAEELHSELGQCVGYKVRFTDEISAKTRIKVMTDGILLAEIQKDPDLRRYSVLIVDEAHERSLNIDFLLGYLKKLLKRREDLKLIITSATLDHQHFAEHFSEPGRPVPVVEVSGRAYPVEIYYQDSVDPETNEPRDLYESVYHALQGVISKRSGDVLIFLSTEREIHELSDFLSEKNLYHSEVIPLYARLSVGAQQKAFKLGQRRRIILSTNVAETSVTVPGVHCVIDTGKARISRYSYRSKVQHLPIEPISKASARQRTGRAGRIAPGICIRLYSEADFLARPDYTEPEILRTNLAAVILKMKVERLGAIENFPFLDPPDTRYIKDGYRLLHELQALDERNQLLPIGRAMSYWQVEPRLARMIVAAKDHGVLREILIIASFLSVPDPRERPREAMKQADEAHQRFWLPGSDFLTILNLWDQSRGYSNTKLKDFCHSNFLSFLRMREWQDIHQQLLDQAIRLNWKINEKSEGEYADISIHRAILTGLLSHIAEWNEEKRYRGARHVEWHLHPGSSLFKTPPKWIGAYEVVETGRCYARTVAKIDPEWLESAAAHLIKKSYSEPHWQDRAGYVAAFLKISLYGLEIIPKRRINYGPIDPIAAREVFIREALVAGRFQSQAEFYRHNQSLREELSEWEDKARRQDILVSDEKLYEFYESRIHTSVYDGPSFKKWWSGLSNEALQILKLRPEDLIESASIQGEQYPDEWIDGALTLPLVYHFAPGEPDDGVTVVVPQSLLNQLQPEPLEWGVPGLLEEKIEALIRSLPKPLRRACIPVSNYAHACVMACESIDRHARLLQTIAETLSRLTVKIEADDFDPTTLEPHLIMNIRVVDEAGKVLGEGRDLSALKARFAVELEIERYLPESWKKSNRTDWDFGTLPASKELFVQGVKFNLFPTFEDHGASVALNWIEDQSMAEEGIHIGVRRLLFLACASQRSALRLNAPEWDEAVRFYRNLAKESEARDDIALHIVNRVFGGDYRAIRSQDAFEALLAKRSEFESVAKEACRQIALVLSQYESLHQRVHKKSIPLAVLESYQDIQLQLVNLCYPGFLSEMPLNMFRRLPIYLKSISERLDRLDHHPAKDREGLVQVASLSKVCMALKVPLADPIRMALEEFRLSLFSPQKAQLIWTKKEIEQKLASREE